MLQPTPAPDSERDGPTGEEDEEFGGIGDGEVRVGEGLEGIPGDVVDEDREQGKAAPEIDGIGFAQCRSRNAPSRCELYECIHAAGFSPGSTALIGRLLTRKRSLFALRAVSLSS